MTPERKKKIKRVMSARQNDLHVVIENVDDPHNVGAILRSCDAFGVGHVHLLYTNNRAPRLAELRSKAAASSLKWLDVTKWDSIKKLLAFFKKHKIMLAVTTLQGKTQDPACANLAMPIAIVISNEHEGVSKELSKAAKLYLKIPMIGFVQSFNVSVAAALILYEAFRQREKKAIIPLCPVLQNPRQSKQKPRVSLR